MRHFIQESGGDVDETRGCCLVLADVSGGDLGRICWWVLRVMPAGAHPVELAKDTSHRRTELRPDGLEHGELPAAGCGPQSLILKNRGEGLAAPSIQLARNIRMTHRFASYCADTHVGGVA